MFSITQIEEIVDHVASLSTETRIYIGCDSVRKMGSDGKPYSRYATVLVVHKNGNNGCRVWSHVSIEPNYDQKKNKPAQRLMGEVYKVCELYLEVAPLLDGHVIEIHLDVNSDPKHGSNIVEKQAVSYVIGMTGVKPMIKPDAWAASFGADHVANGRLVQS